MKHQNKDGRRTVVKSCRVTLEEDLILRNNAQAIGLTMTEFMRSRLFPRRRDEL